MTLSAIVRPHFDAPPGDRGVCSSLRAIRMTAQGEDWSSALWLAEAALNQSCCQGSAGCVWRSLVTLICAGDIVSADHHAARLLDAVPSPATAAARKGMYLLVRARIARNCGDLGGARDLLKELIDLPADTAMHAVAVAGLAEVLVDQGAAEVAEALLIKHRIDEVLAADPPGSTLLLAARGAVHVAHGRDRAGLADYLACGRELIAEGVYNPAVLPWRTKAAFASVRAGLDYLATTLVHDEWAAASRWGDSRSLGISLSSVALIGDDDHTMELLSEAADLLNLANARSELSMVNYEIGLRMARFNQVNSAQSYLEKARKQAEQAGQAHGSQAAARALRELPLDRPADTVRLSEHERRVAELARMGLDNKQIAARLSLTRRTVEFHLTNAYRKLRIESRAELRSSTLDDR